MVEMMLPDGTWVEMTDDEARREMSEEEWDALTAPDSTDPDVVRLAEKMTDQALTNNALAAAGIEDLDDLPVEGEPPVTLDDLEPREYDYEGALRDLREREAREREAGA